MSDQSGCPGTPLHVTVVTVAHRGDDARIAFRQIEALLSSGASVRFIAPAPVAVATGEPSASIERVVIDRASGRKRFGPWWQVHRAIRQRCGTTDIVLVHDLEAVIPVLLARPRCPVVWDVHEDMVGSVDDRAWVPAPLRPAMKWLVSAIQRLVASRVRLVLAESSYQERFGAWPVVPNSTMVPDELPAFQQRTRPYVVYVGRLSRARGVHAMIQLGHDLEGEVDVVLVGAVDTDVEDALLEAVDEGLVDWRGPLANPEALSLLSGASAGLCLLESLDNYVVSMPTKVYEYFAHGVPAIVSPLPLAIEAVQDANAGIVVDPNDREAVLAAVRVFTADPNLRRSAGRRGYDWVRRHHDWRVDGPQFVSVLTDWARGGCRSRGSCGGASRPL